MNAPRAVIFDLGGTLVQWADWEDGAAAKWSVAYEAFLRAVVHAGRGHPLAIVLGPLRALSAAGRTPLGGLDVQLGHGCSPP